MDVSKSSGSPPAARPPVLILGTAAAAATALWVRHRARRAEREHPPAGQFVEVDGVRLHYVERGQGPVVVLLHGNTVVLQDFIGSGLVDRLSERHRVVAFDSPGFGYSERPRDRVWTAQAQAEILHRAFVRLGLERPVVVAHSWGTLIALAMALEHPDTVRGLVLVSGYYYPTLRLDVPLAAPPAIPVLGDAMRYTVTPVLARLLLKSTVKLMFWPRPVPGDFFEPMPREMLLRPSQLRAVAEDAAFMVPAALKLRPRYRELRMPVSLFAGERDKIVSPEAHAVRLHQELPHSELERVPGVGHMLHYAVPEKVVRAVERMTGPAPMELVTKALTEPRAAFAADAAVASPAGGAAAGTGP